MEKETSPSLFCGGKIEETIARMHSGNVERIASARLGDTVLSRVLKVKPEADMSFLDKLSSIATRFDDEINHRKNGKRINHNSLNSILEDLHGLIHAALNGFGEKKPNPKQETKNAHKKGKQKAS